MSILIVVTEPEFRRAEDTFRTAEGVECLPVPADEASVAAALRSTGARYAIVGHSRYTDALYAALPPGGVIARFGVGHDGIDKAKATAAGLLSTNTPGTLDVSVAEFTMLLIATAARHLPVMDRDLRAGEWRQRGGLELAGRTLAFIGAGKIAQATARIASRGYGMRTVGCRRTAATIGPDARDGFDVMTDRFDEAVRAADFVSLHMPASPENLRFMSAERLAILAPAAWLINTARGAVVDEVALYDALASGRLAGAALDVFDVEPYVPVDPGRDLRVLPNVILAPHVGSYTTAANRRMAERAIRNVRLAAEGREAEMDLLNPDVLER